MAWSYNSLFQSHQYVHLYFDSATEGFNLVLAVPSAKMIQLPQFLWIPHMLRVKTVNTVMLRPCWRWLLGLKCFMHGYFKQETCRSIKLRELSACGRFVSHTKATEHKCRMTAHGPSSTSQLRRPQMLRCHCLPPGSLHVLGAFGSLSKSHISFKVT